MTFRGMILISLMAVGSLSLAEEAKVVGWRGDGTGRYPDATPPTEWYQKENGESKNILWKTKLPCYSWATPVIVGDKIFARTVCCGSTTDSTREVNLAPDNHRSGCGHCHKLR